MTAEPRSGESDGSIGGIMSAIKIEWKDGSKVEFGVTRLPNRVNPALYKMRGANVDVLAYFRSEDDAENFERLLDYIIERTSNNAISRKNSANVDIE